MNTTQTTTTTAVIPAAIRVQRPRVSTDQDIRDLPTERKRYKVFTTLVENLFIFVTPKGSKSFAFLYTDAQGKNQTHTVGKFGRFTLATAVDAYENAAKLLEYGECPRAAQLKARTAKNATLATEFADWFPKYSKTVCTEYAERTQSLFDSTRMIGLRNRRLATLDMPQLLEFVQAGETNHSKSFARDVVNLVDKLVEHARSKGRHKGDNPAHGVAERLTPRDTQPWEALQLDDLRQYFADLDAITNGTAKRGKRRTQVRPITVLALRILPFISVRPSVLRHAQWKWIQWDGAQGAMMLVPAFEPGTKQRATERRDDGKGKSYAHYRVPLSRQVVSLLRQLQAITGGSPFLFPGHKRSGHHAPRPVSVASWLIALRRMGWDGTTEARPAITVHGFRALFATSAYTRYVITRMEEHALEFQQDHKLTEGVRAHYTRDKKGSHRGLLLGARAALLQWWADEIEMVLGHNGDTLPQSRAEMAASFVSSQRVSNQPLMIN